MLASAKHVRESGLPLSSVLGVQMTYSQTMVLSLASYHTLAHSSLGSQPPPPFDGP